MARFRQFDQKRQIGSIYDFAIFRGTGLQTQVAGRAAKHVRHHDYSVACIDAVSCCTDFCLFLLPVMIGFDRNRPDAVLNADDMLDGGKILPRQSAMCNDYDSDHRITPPTPAARIGRAALVPYAV